VQPPIALLGLTSAEFVESAHQRGLSRDAALRAYRRAFREGVLETPHAALPEFPMVASHRESLTHKFVLRHGDGLETESVLIPMPHGRAQGLDLHTYTLCVSSQIGCAMGCRFCETAQMGLLRNLTAEQIVAQWFAARHRLSAGREESESTGVGGDDRLGELGGPIKNIVFMGMGEPMDNLDQVLQAVRVLADSNGAAIGPSGISISTVGRLDGIARLGDFVRQSGFRRLNLAVSVNAPNDEIRSSIMPINRSAPMAALREALLAWPMRRGGAFCIEYVLIPGVNDAMEHCDELCAWLKPLRCSLNVIPYNPRRDSPWRAPEEHEIAAFVERAVGHGQFVKRRVTKGRSMMGACGQLGNASIRRRRVVEGATLTVGGTPT
jgi:23S rRNA (adenine2503-C2)-methyltransferase